MAILFIENNESHDMKGKRTNETRPNDLVFNPS